MTTKTNDLIIKTIAENGGTARVNALTHNLDLVREYGDPREVRAHLSALAGNGQLAVYEDGRSVRLA